MMWLRNLFARAAKALTPKLDQSSQLHDARARETFLTQQLVDLAKREELREADRAFHSMVDDLIEARAMAGAGPWKVGPATVAATDALTHSIREGIPLREDVGNASGAYGDIELALQTANWRREINFSMLQFSRWGIQQIILICRLYYIKNPIVRRLIDVCAAYVFARGVEITTSDDAANEALKDFIEDNRQTFGQVALVQAERAKDTDGNLFWCLFPDRVNSGKVAARLIDATEINEIVSNPDDAHEPWYFLRIWTQADFDAVSGQTRNETRHAWYPAMGFDPAEKPTTIRSWPVMWEACVHHRKCGHVGQWTFGCPRAYPMIDWAREARRFLEACASVMQQLSQIALTLTTKGGQQAIEGAKQQLGTTVGPTSSLWDSNPPAVAGAVFAAGTGTKIEGFDSKGGGIDPNRVSWYMRMCCMVPGVPAHFICDTEDTNRATATSLDRPTEIGFLEKQEAWREDLIIIARYVLQTSARSTGGRLSEARGLDAGLRIVECARSMGPRGEVIYEALEPKKGTIEVQVNFPAIREGDMPANVGAIVKAMTLDNKAGQIIGIDEKEGCIALYNALGIEGGEELAEAQYPDHDPDRTKEVIPPPIQRPKAFPGGQQPTAAQAPDQPGEPTPGTSDSAVKEALKRVGAAIAVMESPDGR